MTTKFIGIKELRQNMAKISRNSQRNKSRYIVLNRNKPVFQISPISGSDIYLEKFMAEIEEAKADIRAGRVLSQEEVMARFGL